MTTRGLLADRYPPLWRYGFLARFVVLFLLWGTAAFDYKIFMDLSVRGLVLSALFFLASILVFVGYKTRASMLLLAATLLIHGLLFYHKSSLAGAVLALLSTLLPIGAFYSVDRLLIVGNHPAAYRPSDEALARPLGLQWRLLFAAVLAFNIGGPAYNQIFHHDSKVFLSWHMFHSIARDLVVVHFFGVKGQPHEYVDYIKLLGHEIRRPGVHRNLRAAQDIRIVGIEQLDDVIARVCKRIDDPATLRLDAKMTTLKQGWRQLYDGRTPICDAQGKPLLKTFPVIEDDAASLEDEDT